MHAGAHLKFLLLPIPTDHLKTHTLYPTGVSAPMVSIQPFQKRYLPVHCECAHNQNTSFVVTKVCLSRQCFVVTKVCLSWQNIFVATNICHDKHVFVTTKVFSWQAYLCLSWQKSRHNKHTSVATKDTFCHDKHMLVATELLLQQKSYLWQLRPMKTSSFMQLPKPMINLKFHATA